MLGLWFLFVGVGFVVPVCRCWVCGSCLCMLGLWFLSVDVGFVVPVCRCWVCGSCL